MSELVGRPFLPVMMALLSGNKQWSKSLGAEVPRLFDRSLLPVKMALCYLATSSGQKALVPHFGVWRRCDAGCDG